MDNFTASLPLMLKQLKLSTMLQQWNTLGKKAIEEQWSPQQYLSELCHIELATRDDKRLQRLLKDAKLPVGKHLSSFDFTLVDGVSKPLVADLINQPDWLKHGGNILLFGASGLGKTHIASSIGYGLIEQGHKVKFVAASAIVQQLQQAKRHLRLQDELVKLDKYSLLIVDDVGYVRKTEQETSVLFELIAHRYERHSMIITSNKSFEQWDELFEDSTMTVAAIDRLVHHATIIHCEGDSYRRKTALNKSK
ncbi:ATP-binding protein [Pseudoalteromonas sp. MIP2626]|uniref:IS21-like element helper ATPase IstB n=1 Tax=Pseudoalteromonas sp. MIP2626 TaxID=2705464 RepID=UPI0015CCCD12|nr:IS21-like element helper ATPase IstB [Pseudoalteromonas sp. MIP2626]NYR12060.1 ATP-binding protein [Pseudoalteromonas sp. MIP2626]